MTETFRNGCTMACVDTITICSCLSFSRYQFEFFFILIIYSYLTDSSPELITYTYFLVSSCNSRVLTGISQHNIPPLSDMFYLWRHTYLYSPVRPYCNWCHQGNFLWISSKSSLDVVSLVKLLMLQLLKVHKTGQYVNFTTIW